MVNDKSQQPGSNNHVPLIDSLRGLAIGLVFLFHSLDAAYLSYQPPWRGWLPDLNVPLGFLILSPLTFGCLGVAIFFVISGFCIHLSYESSSRQDWPSFFIRRVFRIYPAYLLALAIFFFSPIKILPLAPATKWWDLAAHILTIHNMWEKTIFSLNPSFWSIAVEIQLYLLYPLFVFSIKKYGWKRSLIFIATIELIIRTTIVIFDLFASKPIPSFWIGSPLTYWFSWGLGAYACEKWRTNEPSRLENLNFLYVTLAAFISIFIRPLRPFGFTLMALATAVFLSKKTRYGAANFRIWPKRVLEKHLSLLGILSYGIYLFHEPLIKMSRTISKYLFPDVYIPSHMMFLIVLLWYPGLLAISFLIFKYIEQPFIQLGKKVTSKRYGFPFGSITAKSKAVPNGT